jgi:hypothetical protein
LFLFCRRLDRVLERFCSYVRAGLCINRSPLQSHKKIRAASSPSPWRLLSKILTFASNVVTMLQGCSACKEVYYCSKEHQRSDWSDSHKPICRYVRQRSPGSSVYIKVEPGEGNGLTNQMTNYVFENKEEGLTFVSESFGGQMSRPLCSQFAEIMRMEV